MKLGNLLKSRREKANVSLRDLAAEVGASKSYLYEVENGKTPNIGLVLAAKLSRSLRVPMSTLAAAALQDDKAQRR
jgi:transcriptional regulator with XRE-family HTH domain